MGGEVDAIQTAIGQISHILSELGEIPGTGVPEAERALDEAFDALDRAGDYLAEAAGLKE